jgi:uncharacterized membrane protein
MPERRPSTLVGVFHTREQAERAVEDLRTAGFRNEDIGFAVRPEEGVKYASVDRDDVDTGPNAAEGALTGALTGGLVAAAMALTVPGIGPVLAGGVLLTALTGMAVGAATGGVVAGLIELGVPEDQAKYYEREVHAGRTVVIVKTGDRMEQAASIFFAHNAYDVDTLGTTTPVETPNVEAMGERESHFGEHDGDIRVNAHRAGAALERNGIPEDAAFDREAESRMVSEGAPDPPHNRPVRGSHDLDDLERPRKTA